MRATELLEALRARGVTFWSGVPCSYLTHAIGLFATTEGFTYVPAANEGEAVAIAAGAAIAGRRAGALMQNSGLGNAVSPLTSLIAPFQIPLLAIVTWRGQPGGKPDEPQHELMGTITPSLLELVRAPALILDPDVARLSETLDRAMARLAEGGASSLLVPAGCFENAALDAPPRRERVVGVLEERMSGRASPSRRDVLDAVERAARDRAAVIATTGYTGRELYAARDAANHLYMVGSMGCASSFALGVALARTELPVIVADGDGAALMRMGALSAIGHVRPANLVHVVIDNGAHESTGGQPTTTDTTDLAEVARACGYPRVVRTDDAACVEEVARSARELTFVHVRCRAGVTQPLPRPTIAPSQVASRFASWIAEARSR
jgi:phosphonopyruvate decarboxylase